MVLIPERKRNPSDLTDYGVVTDDSPLTVQFNGTPAADAVGGVLIADDLTANVGDHVLLVKFGAAWFVIATYTP